MNDFSWGTQPGKDRGRSIYLGARVELNPVVLGIIQGGYLPRLQALEKRRQQEPHPRREDS